MAYKPRKDIKVSESYIQKLRDAGSKKAALEKYGSSTDPKMREALRRFYGASAPAPLTDSKRAKAATLPRKSVAMAKPKSTTMGSRTGGKITVNTKAEEKRKAEFSKRTNRAMTVASAIPVVKGGMVAKAAYGAAAKQVGVAKVKQGVKSKIATKGELKEARSMARGMVKDTAKLKSKTAKTKVTRNVSDTAKYYGSAAKNEMAGRTGRSITMRSTQQEVASAAKKKATSLKRAETTRVKKATSAMMGTAKIDKAKAAAKRASKAGK